MITRTALQQAASDSIRSAVRDIPDFPKPGIVFKDITPVLADADLFATTVALLAEPFAKERITHVVAIESRGFILGAPVARTLGCGFIPVRKRGKLPFKTEWVEYALEYGTDRLEVHADALPTVSRVLIVDDVLATGGTARATCDLVERLGGTIVGFSFLIALGFLPGVQSLEGRRVFSLLTYD